jgi:hypothetical protein
MIEQHIILSIVIPFYNQEASREKVCAEIREVFSSTHTAKMD